MRFNKVKGKVCLEESNPKNTHWLGIDWQECILAKKDLWIQEDHEPNISKQPVLTARKQTAGCINKTTANTILCTCEATLEMLCSVWFFKFKREIKIGECPPR